ncbi:hypothetical protein K7432_013642 [Basidiobolus ranarum]|uniref:FAS1 domain-containing protein n=1 Tax=Basidiobolus ranarum TaxID=34480 RepID=A0ABR2VQI4_9FUNG
MRIQLLLALISTAVVASSPYGRGDRYDRGYDRGGRKGSSVMDILANDRRFSQFMDSLTYESGLVNDLDGNRQEVTVFAPTNEAFEKLRVRYQGRLSPEEISTVLKYHMVPEFLDRQSLVETKLLRTKLREPGLDGQEQQIRVVRRAGHVFLNNLVPIQESGMEAMNGLVHAIDEVVLPPQNMYEMIMKMPTKFSTLSAALQRTGLYRELESQIAITGWAPTNQAFRQLGCQALSYLFSQEGTRDLRKILEYHFTPELLYSTEFEMEDVGTGGGQGFRRGGNSGRDLERPRYRGGDFSHRYDNNELAQDSNSLFSQGYERSHGRGYNRGFGRGSDRKYKQGRRGEVVYLDTFLRGERLLVEAKPSTRSGDNIRINDEAHVLFSDIPAENGVFHAIDHVLLPENLNIPDYDWFDNEDQCDF